MLSISVTRVIIAIYLLFYCGICLSEEVYENPCIFEGELKCYEDFIEFFYKENISIRSAKEFVEIRSLMETEPDGWLERYYSLSGELAKLIKHSDVFANKYHSVLGGLSHSTRAMKFSLLSIFVDASNLTDFRVKVYEYLLRERVLMTSKHPPSFDGVKYSCDKFEYVGEVITTQNEFLGWTGLSQGYFQLVACDKPAGVWRFEVNKNSWVLLTEKEFSKFIDDLDPEFSEIHPDNLRKLKSRIYSTKIGVIKER